MSSIPFPFKTLLVFGILSFVLVDYPPLKVYLASDSDMVKKAEFYPLSSFSMYSTFSETPFLVFITNSSGDKVAIDSSLKTHASELKKTYEIRLKVLKKKLSLPGKITDLPMDVKAEAGQETLTLLKDRPDVQKFLEATADPRLQLHEIVLTAGDHGINQRTSLIAEL